MNKRPVTVTIIGCLLLVVGVAGFAYHLTEVKPQNVFHGENAWIFVVELIAIVGGVYVLRGKNWARWLAVAWMGFHVAISFFDSLQKVVVHVVFFGLIAYSLFRADATAYFRQQRQSAS
jgi:hypothetical protein